MDIGTQPEETTDEWATVIAPSQQAIHLENGGEEVEVVAFRYTPQGPMYELVSPQPDVKWMVSESSIKPINGVTEVISQVIQESPMTTDRIEINPVVMLGKPVIRGTRIPVEVILRKLGEGATEADLLEAYPRLVREDIQAALSYAADSLAHETIVLHSG